MNSSGGARLTESWKLVEPMVVVTEALMTVARKRVAQYCRRRIGATLRPGSETPLWNALVLAVRPHLRRYGEKSRLARILGLPPQRVYSYFKSRERMPDAERTLMLLIWLAQHRKPVAGQDG